MRRFIPVAFILCRLAQEGHAFALQSMTPTTPDGLLHYVEILRCATSIESNAVNTHVVGSRIYQLAP